MEKSVGQLFSERELRLDNAIRLKVADRIPIMLNLGYFPAKYAGITCADAFYDLAKWKIALKRTITELQPDFHLYMRPMSGCALEALDHKQMLWPGGHGYAPNHTFQFVEGEYMKAEEYDAFLEDPTDFLVRTYMPRVNGALQSFEQLPHLTVLLFGPTSILGMSTLDKAVSALSKARQEILRWDSEMNVFDEEIRQLGFPAYTKVSAFTPFDIISDRLRGMRGSMLDMYKRPEKLIQTCDKLLPILLRSAIAHAKATGIPRIYMPLHRGAEGFMSLKQFETFYWPTLKGMILGFIDAGLIPCPFFEGDYTSRLNYLLELPKGKVIGHFDNSDINKVKQIVGGHICIMGNVPPSLLQIGSQQEVKNYCRKLIDDVGKDGGFILASRSALDEAKPENVKAMIDFTKEYGVYR
jgi:hypothetical protein